MINISVATSKSQINHLFFLKSAIYLSMFGGFVLSSNSASAISLVAVNVNLNFQGLFNPSGTLTPPAFLTFDEGPVFATMSLTGGDFDSDSTRTFGVRGDFWQSTFNISQDAGFVNDVLSVNGTFQHITAPHPGDNPLGRIFNFNFKLDADKATGSTISASKNLTLGHPGIGHNDIFESTLTATVSPTINFDDITGWTFTLSATHCDPTGRSLSISQTCSVENIPEPTSTLSLLALGTLGAASTLKRKLKPFKSTGKELEKIS